MCGTRSLVELYGLKRNGYVRMRDGEGEDRLMRGPMVTQECERKVCCRMQGEEPCCRMQ